MIMYMWFLNRSLFVHNTTHEIIDNRYNCQGYNVGRKHPLPDKHYRLCQSKYFRLYGWLNLHNYYMYISIIVVVYLYYVYFNVFSLFRRMSDSEDVRVASPRLSVVSDVLLIKILWLHWLLFTKPHC